MTLVLVVGLTVGTVYGLLAMGLVLTFRTSGIYNLAHGAMGLFATTVFYLLTVQHGVPTLVAFLVCVGVLGPLMGLVTYAAVFRHVRGQSMALVLTASVAVLGAYSGFAAALLRSPPQGRLSLFPDTPINLPGYNADIGQFLTVAFTAIVAVLLLWFLQKTRTGLRMRACVDSNELAQLSAQNTNRIQQLSWMISSSVAALSGILLAGVLGFNPGLFTLLIIQASAAAVLGRLTSMPVAYAGGIGIGLFEAALSRWLPAGSTAQALRQSAAFLVLYLAIVLGATVYKAFAEIEISENSQSLRGESASPARLLPTVVICGAVAVAIPMVSPFFLFMFTAGMIASIMFQSFVLITGLGGQLSLAPAAFMAIGGVLFAKFTTDTGLPVGLAVVLAVLITVVAGLAIGIPAIRVRGLPLVLLTMAFSLFVDRFLMNTPFFGSGRGFLVNRFELFGLDLTSSTSFAYLAVACAFVSALLVRNLAGGRTGRILAAARSSEVGAESFGTSVRRVKLLLFSYAAVSCAVAGILTFLQSQAASGANLTVFQSILFLTLAVVGGIGNPQGALVAGLLLYGLPDVFSNVGLEQLWPPVLSIVTLVVLMRRRGGVGDAFSRPLLRLADEVKAFFSGSVERDVPLRVHSASSDAV